MKARLGKTIAVIPDCQVRPGVDTSHLSWIGNYLAEKQPDYLIQIGDFADMPSLSSYAIGKAEAEGGRYVNDVDATKKAMTRLLAPVRKLRRYKPEMHLALGNHENRIDREAECNPKLLGKLSVADLGYESFGWRVHPFLKIVTIEGIQFSHYFTSGALGRPVSSAAALLRERQASAIQGHCQHTDISIHRRTGNIAMFVGTCYLHDEPYLGEQGNDYRRQIVMLHECDGKGHFDPMLVSLKFLRTRYS